MNFASGTLLQIAGYDGYPGQGGELYAIGSPGNEITFKPYSGIAGGWEGIYFHDYSDNWGGISTMKYCVVDKGNEYNVYTATTAQPSFDYCIFSNAIQYANKGIRFITPNSQLQLSKRWKFIHYFDWSCNSHLMGNTYAGNNPDLIALEGGDHTEDRTFYNDGIEYHVLNTIRLVRSNDFRTLTIEPGVTLNF